MNKRIWLLIGLSISGLLQADVIKDIKEGVKDRVSELRTLVKNDTDDMIFVAWKGTLTRKGSYSRIKPHESKSFVHSGDTLQVEVVPVKQITRLEEDLTDTKKNKNLVGRGYKSVTVSKEGNKPVVKSSK